MAFLLKSYRLVLNRFPVAVQAFQAGALMGVGDVLAQTMVERKRLSQLDIKRTAAFSAVGLIVIGGPLRVWYGVLDKLVGSSSSSAAVKKMAIDQLCFAPLFITVVMGSIGVAQGQGATEIKARLRQDYWDVMVANYKLWPAVQLCNFYLIPLRHQVLAVQCVAVLWNTYLSYKSNTQLKQDNLCN